MNSDRELLELAAKAAGYTFGEKYDVPDRYYPWCNEFEGYWNPLTDDGDALRLAVKLGVDIGFGFGDCGETICVIIYSQVTSVENNDPYAATRRAIVKAAAEIGKGVPQRIVGDVPVDEER